MLTGRSFALVGFGADVAGSLGQAFEDAGATCRVEPAEAAPALLRALDGYDAAVIDLDGLDAAVLPALLQAATRPLLGVGLEDTVMAHLASFRHPARAFAIDTCSDAELVMRAAMLPSAAAQPRAATPAPAPQAAAPPLKPHAVPAPRPQAGPRVIVADDDPVATALLEQALSHLGITCRTVADGDEALALARSLRPDAMVLDVNMPGLDGFQVLEALRAAPMTAGMRVLLLTGRADEDDVLRGRRLRTDGYMVKPFRAADVAERVQALLATKAARAS